MSAASTVDGTRRPWRMLGRAVAWDLRLQLRYQIITVAAVVTAIYALVFRILPETAGDRPLVMILFSDPSVLGFLFVGVLVLFERGANTLQAVAVTPLSAAHYLWAKAISLTAVATASGWAIALAGWGWRLGHAALVAALVLTSLLFVFLGVVGVARARSVNEYLLIVPLFLAPINLPLLAFLGIAESPLFYLLPTQASVVLFRAAFEARPAWEIAYALVYLPLSVFGAFLWARRAFERSLRAGGRVR